MTALLTVLGVLAYLYIFWAAYVLTMGLYRAHLDGRLAGLARWLAYPVVLMAVLIDALAQYTLATVIFLDLPHRGDHLVTQRLQRYLLTRDDWRYRMATAVCTGLLDPFDPSGRHCK